jgi:superfamily II DNA/RNA helicase
VRTIVVDEADRMCDMGFFPQVEFLFQRLKHREQTLLFSATLDGQVNMLIKIYMREPVYHDVVGEETNVAEMKQLFFQVTRHNKSDVAAAIGRGGDKVLMFTRTKRGADLLVKQLATAGVRAAAIHGDRRQESRERELARFTDGSLSVLVATNVAARGLHIDGIDIVVHYDPPEDPKDYVHRSGRTARAGELGVVVSLALPSQSFDFWLLQREIGVKIDPIPVRADDSRLSDLASWPEA